MPSHLGAFILSYSRREMNKFIFVIDGFKYFVIYYTDTDSLFISRKHWDKLNLANLVGNNLMQGKNDYAKDAGIFYGLFLGSKIKYCLTLNADGEINEHKTFKGFTKTNLTFVEFLKLAHNTNLDNQIMPNRWKKSFLDGVTYKGDEEKTFSYQINISKRKIADENGFMEPYNNVYEKDYPPNYTPVEETIQDY